MQRVGSQHKPAVSVPHDNLAEAAPSKVAKSINGYGFAVASTDTGHNSTSVDITWALNEPERKIDFGYRATHGSAVIAKSLIHHWYGSKPVYSYFSGCSTGGAQGFALMQLYPHMFDGLYAGSPGFQYSHLALSFLWNAQQTNVGHAINSTVCYSANRVGFRPPSQAYRCKI